MGAFMAGKNTLLLLPSNATAAGFPAVLPHLDRVIPAEAEPREEESGNY
jgi:hypothetical protein